MTRRSVSVGFRVLGVLFTLGFGVGTQAAEKEGQAPYNVVEGKVDRSTFLGWRVFHSTCYICHGVDATGTSVAPDLVARVKDLSASEFANAVLVRYRVTLNSGEALGDDRTAVRAGFLELVMKKERGELMMPGWDKDPNVKPHVMDIYGYLRARADGVLGPGRPEQHQ
ncbi:MAG: hypothetical protein OEQ18_13920 [Gammaproteobacteria bacterium]|nr:hypothetical protein [Gammaproteobacteria bacterium]